MPLLTVFTPVFNLERYIEETISSILSQEFTDFEYILIDDCSSDKTVEIIESFNDPRIRLIKNNTNQGISFNRNLAIEEAKGKYIAMIDGDDIALQGRLEKQIEFLENNEDYGIVGTEIINIDEQGNQIGNIIRFELPNSEIPSRMLFNNYIATSSTMIRLSSLGEIRFKKEFIVAEDYEVWIQLIRKAKIGQIRIPLTKYRIHSNSISVKKKQLMLDTEIKLIKQQLEELKCELTSSEFQVFLDLSKDNQRPYFKNFDIINQTISKLFNANSTTLIFELEEFRSLLFRYWYIFFLNIKSYNLKQLKEIKVSGMYTLLSKKQKFYFIIKSLLNIKSK
jgi:glycosyltransferase involved in cell wall biosynthesis